MMSILQMDFRTAVKITTFTALTLVAAQLLVTSASPSAASVPAAVDSAAEDCSQAFAVLWEGTVPARLSAGHCDIPGETYARQLEGSSDIAVIAEGVLPGGVVADRFADGSELIEGAILCSFDGVSGDRCGVVVDVDYRPSYIPGSYGFLLVDAPCQPGDSGGGWFADGAAAGITSGFRNSTGQCIVSSLDQPWLIERTQLYQP